MLLARYPDSKINTAAIPYYRSEEDTIDYLRDYDAAIVSFEPVNERVLNALPKLKVVSKLGAATGSTRWRCKDTMSVLGGHPASTNVPSPSSRSAWRCPDCATSSISTLRCAAVSASAAHGPPADGPRRRHPWLRRDRHDEPLNLPNLIATPHIGAGSIEARWRMGSTAIDGLTDNFLPEPGKFPFDNR